MEFVFGAFSYTLWNKSNWKQKCIEPTRNLVMAMAKSAVEAQGKRGRGNFLCGLAGLSSPSLVGRLYSVDWTQDWTVGLDWGTGLTESCAHPISKQHTHYYTTICLHHMNWIQGRRPSPDINIDRTRRSFSSHFWNSSYLLRWPSIVPEKV